MSFSAQVKKELTGIGKISRHCDLAELAALINIGGDVTEERIRIRTEQLATAARIEELLERLFRFRPEVRLRLRRKKNELTETAMTDKESGNSQLSKPKKQVAKGIYDIYIFQQKQLVLNACRYPSGYMELIRRQCCKRAFLRGMFLAVGSISNPEKTYHLEFITKNEGLGNQIIALLQEFEIDAKMIRRKHIPVVYLKEGEQIARLLNVMSAHIALMELENIRILKEVKNNVNRRVNFETANLKKTSAAAGQHCEAIAYIEETVGLDYLNADLKELAILRKQNIEASLKDLGKLLQVPIGRSGVNHRLQKIIEIAEKIKEGRLQDDE